MASVAAAADVVVAIAAPSDGLAVVAAAALAAIVLGFLIVHQFPNGEGETVQGIGGGSRRHWKMGKQVEGKQVAVEENIISWR